MFVSLSHRNQPEIMMWARYELDDGLNKEKTGIYRSTVRPVRSFLTYECVSVCTSSGTEPQPLNTCDAVCSSSNNPPYVEPLMYHFVNYNDQNFFIIFVLFNNAVCSSDFIASIRIIWFIVKNMKEIGRRLVRGTNLVFLWRDWGKTRNIPVNIVSEPVGIRIEYITNTNQKRYCHSQLVLSHKILSVISN